MIVEVDAGGRVQRVGIDATGPVTSGGGTFRLTLYPDDGGAPDVIEVEARPTDLGWSLIDLTTGRVIDAAVTPLAAGAALVQLPYIDVPVVVDGRRFRRPGDDLARGGEQRLTAPMPGRVLRVLVGVGDEVVPGQALIVIEAMKMENELRAGQAGRVVEVHVTDLTSVDAGRLLVVVASVQADSVIVGTDLGK